MKSNFKTEANVAKENLRAYMMGEMTTKAAYDYVQSGRLDVDIEEYVNDCAKESKYMIRDLVSVFVNFNAQFTLDPRVSDDIWMNYVEIFEDFILEAVKEWDVLDAGALYNVLYDEVLYKTKLLVGEIKRYIEEVL